MKKVLLLLADGFETFEAAAFIDVIGWNLIDGDGTTQLFSCGLKKELNTSFSQKFITDYTVDEIDVNEFDALAIPGGFSEYDFYKDAYDEKFLKLIKDFHNRGRIIATICVGSLPAAKSGILNDKPATTYNKGNGIRQKTLKEFGAKLLNEPIVVSGNIITSWNPSTAVEVAFLLLEKLTSIENTNNVRNLMGFNFK